VVLVVLVVCVPETPLPAFRLLVGSTTVLVVLVL
jgi:hypothetical protein